MFPAPAGMSPQTAPLPADAVYVPRTCGDEPDDMFLDAGFA